MKGKPKLTEEQWQDVAARYEAGEKPKALRAAYNISAGLMNWNMLRLGANPPGAKQLTQLAPGPMIVRRGNHVVRHFSGDEDRLIEQLATQGLSDTEIGHRSGRKPNSIRGRLMTLARQAARREEMQEVA
jgi:hypothetical protein